MTVLWRWVRRLIFAVVFLMLGLVVGGALNARRQPDLKPWHTLVLDDLTASTLDDNFTFAEYAKRETMLYLGVGAVEQLSDPSDRSPVNRYTHGSRSSPHVDGQDWNRSYETEPAVIRGGALLLHGLTDSPYSMRATAEVLRDRGIYSLAMRMPGHGTLPSGLTKATWEDWLAAVRVGARHVRSRIPAGAPLILVGYSNGGALALKYAAEAIERPQDPRPAKLILMSPMVGVTPAARLAWWISLLGHVPFFEKAKWIDVVPEYNPFKYNSFAANAGNQTSRVTRALYADLDRLAAAGKLGELPPILTFQSIVDSTVSAPAIVNALYERLPSNGSELVLFDVNHLSGVDEFVQPDDRTLAERFLGASARPYRRVVVTNASEETREVEARIVEPGASVVTRQPLGMSWPAEVFSLTHVAVPFRMDDPLYGLLPPPTPSTMISLGRLSPRGEKGVLTLATDALMRLSSNPFFPFVADRIGQWLEEPPPR